MRVGWARQEAGTNLVKSPERSSSQGFNIGRWLPQHRPLLVRLLLADNFSYCHQILQPDKFSLLRSLSLSLRCIQPRPAFPTPLDSKTSAADSYSTGRPNTGNNNDDIVREERTPNMQHYDADISTPKASFRMLNVFASDLPEL